MLADIAKWVESFLTSRNIRYEIAPPRTSSLYIEILDRGVQLRISDHSKEKVKGKLLLLKPDEIVVNILDQIRQLELDDILPLDICGYELNRIKDEVLSSAKRDSGDWRGEFLKLLKNPTEKFKDELAYYNLVYGDGTINVTNFHGIYSVVKWHLPGLKLWEAQKVCFWLAYDIRHGNGVKE